MADDIAKSKGWDWAIVSEEAASPWKNPSIESFYLVNRWKSQGKKTFLDLGCGLGRHTILFAKNGFETFAFDISENAVERAKKWAEDESLNVNFKIGDMLELPYNDACFDCIFCRNVISHTNTAGIKKIISELKRVMKDGGECYLTLASKNTWGFKQPWPMVDENTKLRMEEGPEYKIPHFYADIKLIYELFADFKIEILKHIGDFYEHEGKKCESYHYHILIRK